MSYAFTVKKMDWSDAAREASAAARAGGSNREEQPEDWRDDKVPSSGGVKADSRGFVGDKNNIKTGASVRRSVLEKISGGAERTSGASGSDHATIKEGVLKGDYISVAPSPRGTQVSIRREKNGKVLGEYKGAVSSEEHVGAFANVAADYLKNNPGKVFWAGSEFNVSDVALYQ